MSYYYFTDYEGNAVANNSSGRLTLWEARRRGIELLNHIKYLDTVRVNYVDDVNEVDSLVWTINKGEE